MTARELTAALGGSWHGSYGMARCPAHKDRTPSLAIRDAKGKVLVHCHAGCYQGDVIEALKASGLWANEAAECRETFGPAWRDHHRDLVEGAHDRTMGALAIWRSCQSAEGSIVETYLRSRGITIPVPPSIRFHPHLKHADTGLQLPCMVAGVQSPEGAVVAIHRTYLKADGSGKAVVSSPKKMLGPCSGGSVRFAAANRKLAIGEGIESCLSVRQDCPDLPVWAALSATGLKKVGVPDHVEELVILADGDEPGEDAARSLARRVRSSRREVRIARPPRGMDFNDLLLNGQREADHV